MANKTIILDAKYRPLINRVRSIILTHNPEIPRATDEYVVVTALEYFMEGKK